MNKSIASASPCKIFSIYCFSSLDTRVNSNCGSSIVDYDFVCLRILKWSTLVFVIFILLTYEYFPHWFSWNWVWQKKIPIFFNAPLQQWIARIKINEICQTMINDGSALFLAEWKVKAYLFNWFLLSSWLISWILFYIMIFVQAEVLGLDPREVNVDNFASCHKICKNEFSTSTIQTLLMQPSK